MPQTSYPSASNLSAYLTAAGYTSSYVSGLDLATLIATAKSDFEAATGRKFLADDADVVWYFDPPTGRGSKLFLWEGGGPGDLASVTSVVYQPSGASAETLTLNTDYLLLPRNAPSLGEPYTEIDFPQRRWSLPLGSTLRNAIQVTGKRGYATTDHGMPDAAWSAILARGVWLAWNQLTYRATLGGMLAWKEGDVSKEFGVESQKRVAEHADGQYRDAVARFRRVTL